MVQSRPSASGICGSLVLTCAAALLLAASMRASAQAHLGIYGGVPPTTANHPFVAARIVDISAGAGSPAYVIPLNGALNFDFYYAPTVNPFVNMFLGAGVYAIEYLDAAGHAFPAGHVTYLPNSGHTNGVELPGNPPNPTVVRGPLGIQGRVLLSVGPVDYRPVSGATVTITSPVVTDYSLSLKTNAAGFYTFYYTGGVQEGFIPPGHYVVTCSLDGMTETRDIYYSPNTDFGTPDYFVKGAKAFASFAFSLP